MRHVQVGVVAVGLLAFGSAHARGDYSSTYAESMYAEYAAGANGQVIFEVSTREKNWQNTIADVPFQQLVGTPSYLISGEQVGLDVQNVRFVAPTESDGFDSFLVTELQNTVRGFEAQGFSLASGQYRTLRVRATIGGQRREHQAVEFCWFAQNHCTLFDPTVMFLDSIAENRINLAAQGREVIEEEESSASGEMGAAARCGLASNPSAISKSLTWAGRTVYYRNALGHTLVRKTLGGQQSGLRCDASCRPQPFGYSYASSCAGFLGWSCACDYKHAYGKSTTTGKWISNTRCTHKYAFAAKAAASVSNLGSLSVAISWYLDGTPDANGGSFTDTCGWF
jgi:hypothetical protein